MPVFNITEDDISKLDDRQLRELVVQLCRAELSKHHLPVSGVTAGGDQNAPDGGIDVRVEVNGSETPSGYIARPVTGIQVKKSNLTAAAITKEMRPKGKLRPAIKKLIQQSGSYIIVSSGASLADEPYQVRLKAMQDAVKGVPNSTQLHLDYYDRTRIVDWVNMHPGVTLWMWEQTGQSLKGWQPYKNWSNPESGINEDYIIDDEARFFDGHHQKDGALSITDGIQRLRSALTSNDDAVRLIGLSGMGKTRLVQALFDDRIGNNALPPELAVYTDIADNPIPAPNDLINQLVHQQKPAIIIVDNCPPTLHNKLSETLKSLTAEPGYNEIHLLTVEYDVADDLPENTQVFRLEPASDTVTEQLLEHRYSHISQPNRQRISEFSGGNARMALAIANTVERQDDIVKFTNKELFNRLFRQRNQPDKDLLHAARICSLVYSFGGDDDGKQEVEFSVLAGLSGMNLDEFYRHIADLKTRGLVQTRGLWHAVLPQALAHHLANDALNRLRPGRTVSVFTNGAPKRLFQSFTYRLGFLHDCKNAQHIVKNLLEPGGLFGDINQWINDDTKMAMFKNIAPVCPEETLTTIERSLSAGTSTIIQDIKFSERPIIVKLLRSLAYDPGLFDRAVNLLIPFVIAEPENHRMNASKDVFKELFYIALSGTHAPIEQRLEIINTLFNDPNDRHQKLGLLALHALLMTSPFPSFYDFKFGARSRDFGWHPKTNDDRKNWYATVIDFILSLVSNNHTLKQSALDILAEQFRGLWTRACMFDDLDHAAAHIANDGFWAKGWLAVGKTLFYDRKRMDKALQDRIKTIEKILRPKNLHDKARAYVLSGPRRNHDIADSDDANDPAATYKKAYDRVRQIGIDVVGDEAVLAELLPEFLSGKDNGRRCEFGQGLVLGHPDAKKLWATLTQSLSTIATEDRNLGVLTGALSEIGKTDPELANTILDDAIIDPVLGPYFPYLQTCVDIDERGVERLITSIETGLAGVQHFYQIGRATEPISAKNLDRILSALIQHPDSHSIALEILSMKLLEMGDEKHPIGADLKSVCRKFLEKYNFRKSLKQEDYNLDKIANACLDGKEGAKTAKIICERLHAGFANYTLSEIDFPQLLTCLFRLQPIIALDTFLDSDEIVFRSYSFNDDYPVDSVPMEVILKWANEDAAKRYPILAHAIKLFVTVDKGQAPTVSEKALHLIENAPDKKAVLKSFERQFMPGSWSGHLSAIYDQYSDAIATLKSHSDADIADWAKRCEENLKTRASKEREQEAKKKQARSTF